MEVAVYARVSTERAQQAQTIQQQIERLQAHVTQQPNWHLAEAHIYRDDGYSGAQLNRPGLDHLRDHAGFAEFELVLITAPDRLARKYVHQVLIIEELQAAGCRVEFLERPMSDGPNDQLLLQIRGAVAEYERTLICRAPAPTDRTIITEWRFAPGAETGHHIHAHDYVVVPLTSGTLRLEEADGVRDVQLQMGVSYARPKGIAHNVINTNEHEFRFVEIELK